MDFDVSLIFAILNGKVFAAINRKLQRNFNRSGLGITPEQWTVLFYLSQQDMVTQQALCDMVYKDKPSWSSAKPTPTTDAATSSVSRVTDVPSRSVPRRLPSSPSANPCAD